MHIKQVQHDTLSHLILSRASTFSLAATGDLTLATECLESTQIYLSNSQEVVRVYWFGNTCLINCIQTGDFVVRAFTGEKYSQVCAVLEVISSIFIFFRYHNLYSLRIGWKTLYNVTQ